jgi:hypothetical protein
MNRREEGKMPGCSIFPAVRRAAERSISVENFVTGGSDALVAIEAY